MHLDSRAACSLLKAEVGKVKEERPWTLKASLRAWQQGDAGDMRE